MKRLLLVCVAISSSASAQGTKYQVPPFLVNEAYWLAQQCYFFNEYATLKQQGRWYVLSVFLSREAIRPGSPTSQCGPKPPQLRVYRLINDSSVVFCDSILIDSHRIAIGAGADFDGSGLYKFQIIQSCKPPASGISPLLCSALSLFELTKKAKIRSLLKPGEVPERWRDGHPTGMPLEPVTSEHLNKTPNPEFLAVDDFFEGDPAFRADDFPKVTLIYSWDATTKRLKNASDKFTHRVQPMAQVSRMSDDTKLVTVMERVLALAAVKRFDDAKKLMDLNLTPDRISRWRAEAPEREAAITLERIEERLVTCIARYK